MDVCGLAFAITQLAWGTSTCSAKHAMCDALVFLFIVPQVVYGLADAYYFGIHGEKGEDNRKRTSPSLCAF